MYGGNADFSNSVLITVLLIVHYSRRWADHLQLSAHFLNLLGLLRECCGQGLNLIFLQSDPCRLLFSRGLQLLHDLTLRRHLVYRERRGRTTFAELAVYIYADRDAGDCYTRDALDKARSDESRLADANCPAFVPNVSSSACPDIDVIAATTEVLSCKVADHCVKGARSVILRSRVTNGNV